MKTPNRPNPPAEIEGEALLEWSRICDDLDDAGLTTDRAILVLYCRTWATWREADRLVAQHGSVIKYSNGVPGPAPFWKTSTEMAKQLRALLADMGLTPAARHKMNSKKADETAVPDIDF